MSTNKIEEYLDTVIEQQTEYEETHDDAGSNYAFMPRESWIHNNELQAFIDNNEIDCKGLDIDAIGGLYLDNFEMVSEHMFSTVKPEVFAPFSYAVGEIEIQLEFDSVIDELEIERAELIAVLRDKHYVSSNCKLEGDCFEIYGNSDCFWSAEITADQLQELITEESSE